MCGFVQSILATVPYTVTGFSPSYSAAKEWCAPSETAEKSRPDTTTAAAFMNPLLITAFNNNALPRCRVYITCNTSD